MKAPGASDERDAPAKNARDLERDLDWLSTVIDRRIKSHFNGDIPFRIAELPPPDLAESDSPWAAFLVENEVGPALRIIFALALVPHLRPQLLDVLWLRHEVTQRGFTEFGGAAAPSGGAFLPTGQTAAFLLAGDDLAARFEVMRLIDEEALLGRGGVVRFTGIEDGGSWLFCPLAIDPDWLRRFTTGGGGEVIFAGDLPVRRLATELEWKDLILPAPVLADVEDIARWVDRDANAPERRGRGYTALFHGPPGSGKRLAAALLGRRAGVPVLRVDLSQVLSKYVGETEKNIARLFERAARRRAFLFFEDGEGLFGRIGANPDENTAAPAPLDAGLLLAHLDQFEGLAILSTWSRDRADTALLRRLDAVIHFAPPRADERLRLWQAAVPANSRLESTIDLRRIAERHELGGAAIHRIVRQSLLRAIERGEETILGADLEDGIRKEYVKEGRAHRPLPRAVKEGVG